jgi:hypothetical protein
MSIKNEKRSWKGLNPDEQIEAALEEGLSGDRSGIDGKPVYAELAKSSKAAVRGDDGGLESVMPPGSLTRVCERN